MDRRTFLAGSIAGAAVLGVRGFAAEETPVLHTGSIPVRKSVDIMTSPLSVGFEVLDRRGFDPEKTYSYLAALGVKWARCQTGWGRCEIQRGRYDFSWLDAVVDALLGIGIQPWFNVGYGNRLYTVGAMDEAAVGFVPIYDESAMLGWLKYVDALVRNFKGRVRHYEIWNEPNHSGFWRPRDPDAADYVKLVERTSPVIRKADADALIVGGALAGLPLDYLSRCIRAGLKDHIDILSFHPYRARPEAKYADEISRLRKLLAMNGMTCPLWQGENGCPSVGGAGSVGALSDLDWDETRQAMWLVRRILSDLKQELALTSYFHTVDLVGYRNETNYKGLLRGEAYTPKPAYYAYQRLCALFDTDTTVLKTYEVLVCIPVHAALRDGGDAIEHAVFSRNGKLLYACWYPASLQDSWEKGTVTVELKVPETILLENPVLIDFLSGEVTSFPNVKRVGEKIKVSDMPLQNYPLILADSALIAQ